MKKQIIEKVYHVVVYLRLSSDDGDSKESDSISNQRILISDYLKGKSDFTIIKEMTVLLVRTSIGQAFRK